MVPYVSRVGSSTLCKPNNHNALVFCYLLLIHKRPLYLFTIFIFLYLLSVAFVNSGIVLLFLPL